jgi:hypothetical protein
LAALVAAEITLSTLPITARLTASQQRCRAPTMRIKESAQHIVETHEAALERAKDHHAAGPQVW